MKSVQDDAGKTDIVINKLDPINVYKYLMGRYKFSVVPSARARGHGHRLKDRSQGEAEKETLFSWCE